MERSESIHLPQLTTIAKGHVGTSGTTQLKSST